ncbi:MAG TPA: DUF2157 domain-containing protein [Terracidiphilus sp.]|nr:DUF2157 domain-containing protein [Terracidiphilus sp.]
MTEYDSLLKRWQSAGLLDAEAATRIRVWESAQTSTAGLAAPDARKEARAEGMAWQGRVALILGGILLASGVILFVSAHWDQLGRGMRYLLVMAMVTVFHLGGAVSREKYKGLSTTLHAVGTILTGGAIALVGQIFNIQEHWPAAVLMWAIAALLGWILLRDQAQQTLTLLLFPTWLMCEWSNAAENHIGQEPYIGRMLFVWAILYLTLFIGTDRRVVRGILFAVSAIAAVTSIFFLLEGWHSWYGMQSYPPFHTRFWGWVDIAAIPLLFSLFRLRKSLIPVLGATAFVIALPWCNRLFVEHFDNGNTHTSWTRTEPNLAAHALVAAFCVFLIWWGVREASRGLVNLGTVFFGATVTWFYFSDLFDKMGRSLGLIGLGVLFLAGGWALEKTRRGLLAHMSQPPASLGEVR